ncbi:MAG: MFS transporter [Planctomycetota bacterium]
MRATLGESLPELPDAVGRAGMAVVGFGEEQDLRILAAGGANFPTTPPWIGGRKVFYRDVWLLESTPSGKSWRRIGELAEPIAYAAFAVHPEGMVIAGGANEHGHSRAVRLVRIDGSSRPLPPLPTTLAYAAFASARGRLWIIGGQATPQSATAQASLHWLDIARADGTWQTRQLPAGDRILATAGVLDGVLYAIGGCRLTRGADGVPARTYLRDILAIRIDDLDGRSQPGTLIPTQLPWPMAASAGPAIAREGTLLFAGADDGSHYGRPPQDHPGQRAEILAFDPRAASVRAIGTLPTGVVTAPLVRSGTSAVVVSGETKPGVRTPQLQAIELEYDRPFEWSDWAVVTLGSLALLAIATSRRRTRALADASDRPGRAAWLVVGLLFVVAALNYLDRQLLATMAEPILRDIPQTNAQFGLLTAVFLFVYSALSPVGGVLADRHSRRLVILVSLVVWSVVTWLTGRVSTYGELVVVRALMGVSEAFYIPAALALITDFHRGKTRSLATGLHMSGIYVGQALAGLGGYAADQVGWRTAFTVFGLVGVSYSLILVIFLREPEDKDDAPDLEARVSAGVATSELLANLFRTRAFWLLLAIMGTASVSNWFVLSWLPRLLQERFGLSLGEAGTLATMPSSIAKYAAVLLGAVAADRLAQRDPRGRARVAALAFLIAGPMIAGTTWLPRDAITWFVVMVTFQGIAQGVLDATLMPILRTQIDERFAASGYGFLNLVGAGFGGLAVLYGGALRDSGIPLDTTLALSGGGLLICGLALAMLPARPGPA